MSALIGGLVAGSFHVVSGPDHLVAVTPLAARSPLQAMRIGAWWGAGHAVGAALLGAVGALAKAAVDVEDLSAWAEFLVGAVLCGVGLWAFVQARKLVVQPHSNAETHDERAQGKHHHATSFGVGVMHGAAGTGHLLGVLPSLALPPLSAAVYLAAYGFAAILAMTLFSGVIGLVGKRLPPGGLRGFLYASGAAAVGLGVYWMATGYPG